VHDAAAPDPAAVTVTEGSAHGVEDLLERERRTLGPNGM
jgi:hypothetical protein